MNKSGKTLFEKVWEDHLVVEETQETPAILYIDLHLIHEVTTPQAFQSLRDQGLPVRAPNKVLATMDHSTPTLPIRSIRDPDIVVEKGPADQIRDMIRNCEEFGIELFGFDSDKRGIVHVIGPELGATQPDVKEVEDAVPHADLVMMLIPDEKQAVMYENHLKETIKNGAVLAFAHGFNIHFEMIMPRDDLDVIMIAPKGPGHTVRSTASFVKESGLDVNRPDAPTAVKKENANILVAIGANNEIWINRRRIDPRAVRANIERMHAENPEGAVIIQADKKAFTETLVTVMDSARQAGVFNVSLRNSLVVKKLYLTPV